MTADDPLTAEELAEASLAIMHREGLKPFTCEEFADGWLKGLVCDAIKRRMARAPRVREAAMTPFMVRCYAADGGLLVEHSTTQYPKTYPRPSCKPPPASLA